MKVFRSDTASQSRLRAVVLIISAMWLSFSSGMASAQVLEEVIVTAQKREQSLQDVPASVSAISGESVNDYVGAGENIRAIAGRVPSLQVESSNGRQSPRFYIRGLGNTDFDVNANQPVSMILDEIALENSVLKSLPLFDVERVEVLKGPQGTLFGRNTPAGIVKIDTKRPAFEREGYIAAGYGSRDTSHIEGAYSGQLSDNAASRLSIKYLNREPWIDNTAGVAGVPDEFGGFDEFSYRLQFLYESNDDLTALVKLHGFHQDGDQPQIFYANALEQGSDGVRSGFDESIVSQDAQQGFFLDHFGATLNLTYEFKNVTFISITGFDTYENFSQGDVDGGLISFDPADIGELGRQVFFNVHTGDGLDGDQFQQEFRLSGGNDSWFYQVGLFYFDETINISNNRYMNAGTTPVDVTFVDQDTTSFAVFGQVEYSLTDQFRLTVGLRYTDDDKDLDVTPGPGSAAAADSISAADDYISWDIAGNYDVNDSVSVYSRIGQSSRGPVTIGRFGFVSSAETETLTSYEIGFKSVLFDGAARWNAAVYSYTIDDQQLTATGGADLANSLLNSDETVGSGFETDFEWLITDNFRLMSNLSYNDTEIKDSDLRAEQCGSAPGCTGLDPVAGVFPGPFGPITSVNVSGNPLPRAPDWLFNIALAYDVPLSSGAALFFNTDWNYRGESNIFLYEAVEFVAEERWLGGVRFGYRNADDNLEIAIVGRNITDEISVEGAIDFLNLNAFINEPAFWGIEGRFTF